MRRALFMATLAGLAVGLILYLIDIEFDQLSIGSRVDALRRRLSGGDDGVIQDGQGRVDEVLPTGVYPSSAGSAPSSARAQGMASWGQGPRGAAGYEDSGGSELSGLK